MTAARARRVEELPCTHAYVVRMPCCDSVVALLVDDSSADLGREIAKYIKRGRRLERVTIEIARTMGAAMYRCECVPDAAEIRLRRAAERAYTKVWGPRK